MKKILLISGAMPHYAPYVGSYIEILKKNNIPFDLICWNRNLDPIEADHLEYIIYNEDGDIRKPNWKKLIDLYGFSRFVKKQIYKSNYNAVVVFTISECIFLQKYLQSHFEKRYIFDIRDYSALLKIKLFRIIVEKMIEYSKFTVLSSVGFLNWLPSGDKYSYSVVHNTSVLLLEKQKDRSIQSLALGKNKIKILTIGQLRDYESNSTVIERLANNPNYHLQFSGSGSAEEKLQKYSEDILAKNVTFTGRYKKEYEETIVEDFDMINIYFNHDVNSDSLMSNRFYLSVLQRKPMIVRKDTFQAELVEQFGLGVVLDDVDDFPKKIEYWWNNFDQEKYNEGCRRFINMVIADMNDFEIKIVDLYKNNQ